MEPLPGALATRGDQADSSSWCQGSAKGGCQFQACRLMYLGGPEHRTLIPGRRSASGFSVDGKSAKVATGASAHL